MGPPFLKGFLQAFDMEKDPRCLKTCFTLLVGLAGKHPEWIKEAIEVGLDSVDGNYWFA